MSARPEPVVPEDVYRRMVEMRRDLHRNPELSWQEHRTSQKIAEALQRLGIQYRMGIAGTGVVAEIKGLEDGPLVALRADMDALPVEEETGLDFSSENPGVMHACGHDGHTSMLLGAAELLMADPPPTGVRLIWQPAEEKASGAAAMVRAGVLKGVGMIFGGHVDRHYVPGTIVVTEGSVNASTDLFALEIQGRAGHGARPHEALDAVVVGSLLVTSLQTIVSRETDPADPSVVTIGSFHAGTAANVIAGSARLEGTIRAQRPETRQHLLRSIRRMAAAIAELHEARIDVELFEGTPAVINTAEMAALASRAASTVVGEDNVMPLRTANMGGEDFAEFLQEVPGAYVRFGAQVPGRESYPAHSSRFDFDESALATGSAYYNTVARMAGRQLLGQ